MQDKEKHIIEKVKDWYYAKHPLGIFGPKALKITERTIKLCNESHKDNLKKQADDFGKAMLQISEAHQKEIEKLKRNLNDWIWQAYMFDEMFEDVLAEKQAMTSKIENEGENIVNRIIQRFPRWSPPTCLMFRELLLKELKSLMDKETGR